ncbi:MAG TPA: polysaccharide deacetylase family protein [bacterium]|nr:polysaccharide deacetylase family protein [bacterium]
MKKIIKSILSFNSKNIISLNSNILKFLNDRFLKYYADEIFKQKQYVVVLYHNITDELKNKSIGVNVTSENFKSQILLLKKFFTICRYSDLYNIDYSKLNKPPLIITFDDAYNGVYKNAFPVLKDFKLPAVMFVSPYFVEHQKYLWWDVVYDYLLNLPVSNQNYKLFDNYIYTKYSEESSWHTFKFISNIFVTYPIEKIYEILIKYFQYEKFSYTEMKAMSWDELKTINESVFEIGNHSYNHSFLPMISETDFVNDINKAEKIIQQNLKVNTKLFAIPYGDKNSYNESIIKILQKKEYNSIFMNYGGINNFRNLDSIQINRTALYDYPYIYYKSLI